MDFTNFGLDLSNRVGDGFTPESLLPARVLDVILDSSHPEWNKYGNNSAVGVIKYVQLGLDKETEDINTLPAAFPINGSIRQLPLKNEIVLILKSTSNKTSTSGEYASITYYDTILNIWNTVNHNGLPTRGIEEVDLGEGIDEMPNINPLQPFPGDTLLEGRLGQSIRFTGYPHPLHPFVDQENKTFPLTIISNGQINTESGIEHITEDINEDYSSIYLTSNHSIPLTPAKTKRDSFSNIPVAPNAYKGNQVIINGGRLYFNAKEEDIHFNSFKNIGLTSQVVGIDSEDYIGLDSKKIYLGKQARKFEQQPVILGNQLEILLASLLTSLDRLGGVLTTATTVSGQAIPTVNLEGSALQAVLRSLSKQINPNGPSQIKSKKVFTE
jgi:hypothetical protein